MSDTKTPGDKTLSVTPPKTLSLKRPVEQSTVRQSFSHGRTKQVVVEVKRRVSGHEPVAAPVARAPQPQQQAPTPPRPQAPQPAPQASRPAGSMLLRTLSDDEKGRASARPLRRPRHRGGGPRPRRGGSAPARPPVSSVNAPSARPPRRASARKKTAGVRKTSISAGAESAARQRMSEEAAPPRPAPPRDAAPSAAPSAPSYTQTPRPAPSGPRETREFGGPRPPARDVGARPPRLDFRPPRSDSPRPPRPDANATAEPLVARPARQAPSSAGAPRSRPDDGEARPAFRRPGGSPGGAPRGAPAPAPKTPKVGENAARPPDAVDRHGRGRRADTLARLVPPPRAAHDRPSCLGCRQGARDARGDHPGDDHHPGTRQPHDRAGRRRHPPADEAGRECTRSPT